MTLPSGLRYHWYGDSQQPLSEAECRELFQDATVEHAGCRELLLRLTDGRLVVVTGESRSIRVLHAYLSGDEDEDGGGCE